MPEEEEADPVMDQLQQLAAVVQQRDAPGADPAVVAVAPDAIAIIAGHMSDQSKSD